jgi:L-rhamnonate dehydratase
LLGQPVYRLLGGPSRDKIALYCTSDDLDWAQELGFKAFKVSNPAHYEMGLDGLNLVEEKIAKARAAVGANAELMFNPVMSFNVEFTLRLAERLRPYGLRWLEEPLMPSDLEGHIQLKRAITWIPLATGEDHHGRHAFRQLVEHRAVDIVQPDLKWSGGLSEVVKIYTIAEAAGIPTIPHTGAGTPFGQHFALAMPESPMAEYWMGSDPGVPLAEVCPVPGMAMPKDGYVVPSDAPGFGMEIKAEWIVPWDHTVAMKARQKT